MATGSLLASAEPTGSRSTQPAAQLLRETPPTRLPAGTLTWILRPLRAGTCPVAFTPALSGSLMPTLLGQVMDTEALPDPPSSQVPPQRPTGMCCAPVEGLWWARIRGPGSCSAHTAVPLFLLSPVSEFWLQICVAVLGGRVPLLAVLLQMEGPPHLQSVPSAHFADEGTEAENLVVGFRGARDRCMWKCHASS